MQLPQLTGFGVNVDLNHFNTSDIDRLIEALNTLQARWVRLEIDYLKYVHKEELEALDYFCTQCNKRDIVVVGLFSQFVPASFSNLFFPHHIHAPVMSNMDIFLKFVKSAVNRWKNHIHYWEIWNEQNSKRFWINKPSPAEYVSFLKEIQIAIHTVNPQAKILFGGVNGNDITPMMYMPKRYFHYTGFIEECIRLGADQYVDMFAFHPYTLSCYISFKKPSSIAEEIISRIKETKEKYGKEQLVVSEIGVSPLLNPRLDAAGIAWIYKEILNYCDSIQIPVSIYTLADQHGSHYGSLNPDRDFGFLDYNLEKKDLLQEFIA